jgi:hypothetical protein
MGRYRASGLEFLDNWLQYSIDTLARIIIIKSRASGDMAQILKLLIQIS